MSLLQDYEMAKRKIGEKSTMPLMFIYKKYVQRKIGININRN